MKDPFNTPKTVIQNVVDGSFIERSSIRRNRDANSAKFSSSEDRNVPHARVLREPAKLNHMQRATIDLEMMSRQKTHEDQKKEEKQDDDSDSPVNCFDKLRSCCRILEQVEIDLPEHHRIKVQDYTYRMVRWWTIVMFLASLFSSLFASDFLLDETPVQFILGYVLNGMIALCLALSFCLDSMNFSVAAAYIYHVRLLLNLTVPVKYDDPATRFKNMANLTQVSIVAFFNAFLFTQVNPWRRSLQYFINVVI